MKTIPLTNGKCAIVDEADYEALKKHKWCMSHGYPARRLSKAEDPLQRTLYMHRIIMRAQEGELVDHRNRDRLDNRRENLRVCTYGQNRANAIASTNSKTGVKGVSLKKGAKEKPYRTSMKFRGQTVFDKRFDTLEEAKAYYDENQKFYFGEYSRS